MDAEPESPENLYRTCKEHASRPDPKLTCQPPQYFLGRYVYKLFVEEDKREHMWIYVERIKEDGKTLEGLLWNDPRILTRIKFRDVVEVKVSEIEKIT